MLIKAVYKSCFRLPTKISEDLQADLMAKFWWASTRGKKWMHWFKWVEVCKSKNNGGLGFRSLVEFNRVMLAKQI